MLLANLTELQGREFAVGSTPLEYTASFEPRFKLWSRKWTHFPERLQQTMCRPCLVLLFGVVCFAFLSDAVYHCLPHGIARVMRVLQESRRAARQKRTMRLRSNLGWTGANGSSSESFDRQAIAPLQFQTGPGRNAKAGRADTLRRRGGRRGLTGRCQFSEECSTKSKTWVLI